MMSMRKNETFAHYFISLWPTAPFFGVEWRYQKMIPGAEFFNPAAVMAQMTRAGAREAAQATEEAVEGAVEAVEAVARTVEHATHATDAVEAAVVVDAETVEDALVRPASLLDAAPETVDDLKLIKGVGPKLEALLNELGVYTFDQIAGFSEGDLAWIDENLATFKGRPMRDGWIEQAKALR